VSRLDRLIKLHDADPADADVRYMIAQEHAGNGDHAEACAWYLKCLDVDPDYLYAYYHRAVALLALGEKDAAATALRDGVERARAVGDAKAAAEMNDLLTEAGA